jgi:hypothetical protein
MIWRLQKRIFSRIKVAVMISKPLKNSTMNMEDHSEPGYSGKKKILLMLMPFWDPQIPPLGISCLKSFIQEKDSRYQVKIIDANVEASFREIYAKYFDSIKKHIPESKRRHLYNIGHDILRNQAAAHLNYENYEEYKELVRMLVFNTFYCDVNNQLVNRLIEVMAAFFTELGKYIGNLIGKEMSAVLGLSVYSGTLPASLFAFKLAKEMHPGILTVMGGGIFSSELSPGTSNFQFFLERTPYIDKILVGEGELLFYQLLREELPEAQRVFTLKDIDNKTVELSSIKLPDFSAFDLQYYVQMADYTSRSCPFQCSFCAETVYWGRYRKKRAKQVVDQLVELYERYGSQLFLLCDSLLNPVITELAGEFLKSDIALYWGGYLRADEQVCNKENTFLWRRGGFYRARLGIESGSQRMLDLMNKKISLERMKDSLSSLACAGIKTTAMFVIGYPGETEEDFQKTLDFVEELRDDIYEADCNPFWYLEGGQANSHQWKEKNKSIPLYPQKALDMLMLQTWVLDCQPSRKERYARVNRFLEHCHKLGIPNPYSLEEIYHADERWRKLHKNAVPPLINFQSANNLKYDNYIDECRYIKNLMAAKNILQSDKNWNF